MGSGAVVRGAAGRRWVRAAMGAVSKRRAPLRRLSACRRRRWLLGWPRQARRMQDAVEVYPRENLHTAPRVAPPG